MNVGGLILTGLTDKTWHLIFSIGVLLGAAAGIIGIGLAATVATRWFVKKRGLTLDDGWSSLLRFCSWTVIVCTFNGVDYNNS